MELIYSKRYENVLSIARREAKAMGHKHVGTEHLLLGLMLEHEGVAIQCMLNMQWTIDPNRLRDEIRKVVSSIPKT